MYLITIEVFKPQALQLESGDKPVFGAGGLCARAPSGEINTSLAGQRSAAPTLVPANPANTCCDVDAALGVLDRSFNDARERPLKERC